MFAHFVPEGAGFAPGCAVDAAGVLEGGFEEVQALGGETLVLDADEEFVVNHEAAFVHVGGADVGDVVEAEEFGVEDLWLVFVEFDAGAEEVLVEFVGGDLGKGDVGFAGKDEADAAAAADDADDFAPELAGREEVGGDDVGVAGGFEIGLESVAHEEGAAARGGGEELAVRGGGDALDGGAAEACEEVVAVIGHGPEGVEGEGEFPGDGGGDAHAEVVPAFFDAIALVFGADVEAADDADLVVANDAFAVVAEAEAFEFEGIEPAEFAAGLLERIEEFFGERNGAE